MSSLPSDRPAALETIGEAGQIHARFNHPRSQIGRILSENALSGPELVVFGDGNVELENARAVGGLAVGVASLETGGTGRELGKRERLRQVGAQILVPDWQEGDLMLRHLGVC